LRHAGARESSRLRAVTSPVVRQPGGVSRRSRARDRARAADGQASVEWLAVVALVVALLAVGAAAARADFLGRRVTRELARALCRVGHGDCERDREPCVVSSAGRRTGMVVSLGFVRFGGRQVGLVEQRSDGSVAVTIGDETEGGLTAGVGGGLSVLGLKLGGTLGASVAAQLEHGRTWIVPSAAAAQDLIARQRDARLAHRPDGSPPATLPAPDIRYDGVQVTSTGGASADAGAVITLGHAGGALTFDRRARQSVDARTGHRTIYTEATWTGDVGAAVKGVLDVSRTLASSGGERYAVEFDAAGRPLDLQIVAAGTYGSSADLPGVVSDAEGLLEAPADGTRLYEVTAHLDLTDPVNLAAARDLLGDIAHRKAGAAASERLRRRIAQVGSIEARALAQTTSDHDVSGELAAVAKLGLEYRHDASATHLLTAISRGLDGQWLPREDCVVDA
jgi:hypothetical protein